jgi:SAM-dependent methyltransferase
MASTTDFYEGRWAQPDFSAGSIRNWLVKKQRFFVRRLSGRRGRLLDLGCGGGWRLYTRVGPVVGVDVSAASLKTARRLYQHVVQASLEHLPFREASFDLVVSSDVLGHVSIEAKDGALSEAVRVLRPGGITLHYVEAEGADPVTRFAKGQAELYRRHIIEPEGHVGLEPAQQVCERFRARGLTPRSERPSYKLLLYVGRVAQYFDNEYRRRSRLIAASAVVCRALRRVPPVEAAANVLVSLTLELTDRLLPDDWASGVLVEYEKPR